MRIKTTGFEQASLEDGNELSIVLGAPKLGTNIPQVAPTAGSCAALQDDFDNGLDNTRWSTISGTGPIGVTNRMLQFDPDPESAFVTDAFSRTTSNGWGSAPTGGSWTNTGGSASDFSVGSSVGKHSAGSVNVARTTTINSTDNFDVSVKVATDAVAAGASINAAIIGRWQDSSNYYIFRLRATSVAGHQIFAAIQKNVSGTPTTLGSEVGTALNHTANTYYWIRARAIGSLLQMKIWADGTTEPDAWDVSLSDSTFTAAGPVGVRSLLTTGNTNTLPVVFSFDNFTANIPVSSAVRSVSSYDLTGSQMAVKVRQATSDDQGVETVLSAYINATNDIFISKSGASILFGYRLNGVLSITSDDYIAARDFCWRIRESSGNILWETSRNGMTWTTRRTLANPFSAGVIASVKPTMSVATYIPVTDPASAAFDDFNLCGVVYSEDTVRSGSYGLRLSYGDAFMVSATTKGGGGYFRAYVKLHSLTNILGNAFMSFFRDTDFCSIVALDINQDGTLQLNYRRDIDDPDASGIILGDKSPQLEIDRWHCIEMAIIGDESTDVKHLEARFDNVLFVQADVSDISAYDGYFSMGSGGVLDGSYDFSVDDIAINNGAGTDNNTWCGPGKVLLLPVIDNLEAEKSGTWLHGGTDSGSEWGQVDDVTPPDDAQSYLIADTLGGHIDFKLKSPYELGIRDVDAIKAVSFNMRSRLANNADSADITLQARAGSNLVAEGSKITLEGYFSGQSSTFKDLSFSDDFNRGRIDREIWEATGNIYVSGGTLNISLLQEVAYWNMHSRSAYDLRNGAAIFELVDPGNQALASKEVNLQLYSGSVSTNAVFLYLESTSNGGNLRAYKRVAGVTTSLSGATYNSTTMRWIRIREQDGYTYWEYAADEFGPWTTLHSAANPISLSSVYMAIEAGTYSAESSNTTVKFGAMRFIGSSTPHYITGDQQALSRDIYSSAHLPGSTQPWTAANLAASRVGLQTEATGSSSKRDAWLFPDSNIDPTGDITSNEWYTLKPIWYELNSSGVLVLRDSSSFGTHFYYTADNAALVKANSEEQYVCVASANATWMNSLCSNSTKRANAISTLITFCQDNDFTGVELDFEAFGVWTLTQYTNYKTFLTELGNALHDYNLKLMVDLPPIWNNSTTVTANEWTSRNSQGYYQLKYEDFETLPVDYLVPMAYDYQYDMSAGTPNQPLQWLQDILAWMKSKVSDDSRIIAGLPSAGYSGTTDDYDIVGRTYTYLSGQTGFSTAARNAASGELIWASGGTSYAAIDDEAINQKRAAAEAQSVYRQSLWHVGQNRYGLLGGSTPPIQITSIWAYVDYVPAILSNSVSLKIDGVERYFDVIKGTPYIDDRLNEQANTFKFDLEDLHNLGTPENDQVVEFVINGITMFAGTIARVTFTQRSNTSDIISIECTDWTPLLDRRLVATTVNSVTDKAAIEQVASQYWSDEGITTYHVSETANISQMSFNYIAGTQTMKNIADVTGNNWYVDYDKDLHYFPHTENRAPFDITSTGNKHRGFKLTKDGTRVRNRVFVRGGTELTTDPYTETIVADGVQTQFLLAEKPHDITVTVDGVSKTVGIKNIDDPADFDFLMNFQEKYVEVASGGIPASGAEVSFSYQYEVPILVSVEDSESIAERREATGGSGVYEYSIIDSNIKTTQQARDRAVAELTDYANDMIDASYETMETGLRSGQYQRVTMANKGVDEDYIINSVTGRSIGGGVFVYTVKLTNAKQLGIVRFLIQMLQNNKAVGTIDPNEKVDGLLTFSDTIASITDSLTIDSAPTTFKWSNDAGSTSNKLKWNLGQWS